LKLQDLKLRFDEIKNANIFSVSYFRDDKDCNTFFPDEIEKEKEIDLEMYNTTVIYMVPKDRNQDQDFRFSWEIF
jgi:hypothetical protein